MIRIFIGYDSRETIAFHVCANSIIRLSNTPVSIIPLALNLLKDYTETHRDSSNQFTYTRFLVPHLVNYKGWALFLDGDMILNDDITTLWNLRDESKAVMVVKHDYITKQTMKYLGSKNENYPRKNWSSVVLWNCSHPANKIVTKEFVEKSSGQALHRFTWLDDSLIGELPIEWNWLADEYGSNQSAKLIHYTLGTPCFDDYKDSPMADKWHRELELTTFFQQINNEKGE